MKTLAAVLGSAAMFLVPFISSANIATLNGLSSTAQILSVSTSSVPHLSITSSGTTHTFSWDNTPWTLAQGGTGATTTFSNGSIPFIKNGIFSANALQFFWDSVSNLFAVGGTTTISAKIMVKGSGSTALLNLASSTGSSLVIVTSSGKVGIGTSSPFEVLDVIGNGRFSGSVTANSFTALNTSNFTTGLFSGRVAIGGGSAASALDVTGMMYSRMVTATSSYIAWQLGNVQSLTLSSNQTLTFAGGQAGGKYDLIITQDGTGNRTITWPASVKWPGGTAPTLSTAANAVDTVSFIYDGTSYLGTFALNYAMGGRTVNFLVVAGGGGGARNDGNTGGSGGGGGGGVRTGSLAVISGVGLTVTVGAGGLGHTGSLGDGNNGDNSVFASITSIGGGGGAGGFGSGGRPGIAGGSGSGASGNISSAQTGGTGTAGQGNNGGSTASNVTGGAGGGGAGAVGGNGSGVQGGNGGDGSTSSISGASVYYGGGGGGANNDNNPGGTGGQGGGGAAAADSNSQGTAGTDGTGGGAGASGYNNQDGVDGGDGIVIISAPIGTISSATGGTHTTSGGNDIWTFTSSGTWTPTF